MNTVRLPAELRAETPRLLLELAVGETGYVGLRALIVAPDLDCFLDPRGALERPGLLQMKVRRDEEGFHVVLPAGPHFTPEQIMNGMDVLPIASVVISKEKWSPGPEE